MHKKSNINHDTNKGMKQITKIIPSIDPWKIATVILAILLVVSVFGGFSFDKKLSKEDAKEKTQAFLNELMRGQATAVVQEITEEQGLYKVKLDVGGTEYDS